MRHRITVRGEGIELRGFIDADKVDLPDFAHILDGVGVVIASPMEGGPSDGQPSLEKSIDVVQSTMIGQPDLVSAVEAVAALHYGQAMVIRGERDQREEAIRAMHERELHHFEVEQENAALREEIRAMRTT